LGDWVGSSDLDILDEFCFVALQTTTPRYAW